MDLVDLVRGCLLGGACGDALGAPFEFLSTEEISARAGPQGPDRYGVPPSPSSSPRPPSPPEPPTPPGWITDDTQMSLFTAEGMIRAAVRGRERGICHAAGVVHHAYLRWLHTQGVTLRAFADLPGFPDGWLVRQPFLHAVRGPGRTCLGALRAFDGRLGEPAKNGSKGCGTVMRVAPAGLWDLSSSGLDAFAEACEYGALTHGHRTGILAGGFLARVVAGLFGGASLEAALADAVERLRREPGHEETLRAVERARAAAAAGDPGPRQVEKLGEGWVAEEALAIGLYAALVAPDFRAGLRIAVHHGGDSDSTGAIAGNLLGALHGVGAIPPDLLDGLEGRDVIDQVAKDLVHYVVDPPNEWTDGDRERYPGS